MLKMLKILFLKCKIYQKYPIYLSVNLVIFGLISFDRLFNNSHSADHVSSSLEQTFNHRSILRVRQSVGSPLGLNCSVTDNRTGLGKNTFDQFASNPESLGSILNTLRANLINSRLVFRSQLKGIIPGIEVSSIVLTKSNLGQAKKN